MFEIPLHAGSSHPDLVWILVPSFLTFMTGLGIGATSDRFREWISSQDATSGE